MKFTINTLGCKLNFAESSFIAKKLIEAGNVKASAGDIPDVCIINTCTVTDAADHKGRQLIGGIHRKFPDAKIFVTGCYAQLKPDEIAKIDGVTAVLGCNDKFKLPDCFASPLATPNCQLSTINVSPNKQMTPFYGAVSSEGRTRHFLKIQDGCDCFCSYCAIPFARGRSRSGSIEEIVAMAEMVASQGGKEIILTGVNIGDFGKHNGETFLDLIKRLDNVEGIERFRISSIEPDLLTDEIIEFVAHSKRFAPHFHIPLQSGSDEVLKLMRRRYDTKLFKDKILKIKQLIPDAFIGVDMIAGMRGESEELFKESVDFIASLPVTRLHVFPYSERQNTMALKINHSVPMSERKRRVGVMMDWSAKRLEEFCKSFVGTKHAVLWEAAQKGGFMFGFTENYIKVRKPFDRASINMVEEVMLTDENIVIEE